MAGSQVRSTQFHKVKSECYEVITVQNHSALAPTVHASQYQVLQAHNRGIALLPFSKLQGLTLQNVQLERLSAKNSSNPRFSLMESIWLRFEKKMLSFHMDLAISNALSEKS